MEGTGGCDHSEAEWNVLFSQNLNGSFKLCGELYEICLPHADDFLYAAGSTQTRVFLWPRHPVSQEKGEREVDY